MFLIFKLTLLPLCDAADSNCKSNRRGVEYRGKTNVAENGKKCLSWNNQYVRLYQHHKDSNFPDGSVVEASNYCRNPPHRHGLYGYTAFCFVNKKDVDPVSCCTPLCKQEGKLYAMNSFEYLIYIAS